LIHWNIFRFNVKEDVWTDEKACVTHLKITTDDHWTLRSNHDSIIHTFTEWTVTMSIYSSALNWFNYANNVSVNPTTKQILFHLKDVKSNLTTAQEHGLVLLLLCAKQYIYACKIALKTTNAAELQRKIETQWKIENAFQLD